MTAYCKTHTGEFILEDKMNLEYYRKKLAKV